MKTKMIALGLLLAGPMTAACARDALDAPLGYRDAKVVMTHVASLNPVDRAAFWNAPSPVVISGIKYVMSADQVTLVKAKHDNLDAALVQTPAGQHFQWAEGAAVALAVCRPAYTPPMIIVSPAPGFLVLPTDPVARMIAGYDAMDVSTRNRLEDVLDQQYKNSPVGSEAKADAERALRALELPVPS